MIAEFFFWFVSDKKRVHIMLISIISSVVGMLILGGIYIIWGYTFPYVIPCIVGAPFMLFLFLGGPLLQERSQKEVWETKKTRLFTAGFFLNILATFCIVVLVSDVYFPGEHFARLLPFQGISTVFLSVIYTVSGIKLVQYRPQIRL